MGATRITVALSLIIPVRDGEKYLAMCLAGLARSSVVPCEVIVVDDGSTDKSGKVAQDYGARVLRLEKGRGPAAARNAGAAVATQPLLMFLDADVVVHEDTVQRALDAMSGPEAPGAVFGAYDEAPFAPGIISQYRNLLHHFTHSTAQRNATTFWAGCGIIDRELFLQHGGFNERYRKPMVEDIELGLRLYRSGVRILLIPEIQVCHVKSWTFREVIRTDIANRAWPWSRLVLESGSLPDDLNLRWSQRISAAFSWLAVGFVIAASFVPVALAGFLCATVAVILCNRKFLGFLARKRGVLFAAASLGFHMFYFLYSSATFATASLLFAAQNIVTATRSRI